MNLGEQQKTNRGFPVIDWLDAYGKQCSLQVSSIADYDAVWLGLHNVQPMIMAKDAPKVGIETDKDVGWIPYPIPEEVSIHSRMHLNSIQVQCLIEHLQSWLDKGEFV